VGKISLKSQRFSQLIYALYFTLEVFFLGSVEINYLFSFSVMTQATGPERGFFFG